MVSSERTASEWFAEAARCYLEQHQGCAWCGGSYRVFHLRRGSRIEYYCNGCDFQAGHDEDKGEHFSVPGDPRPKKTSETMFEI